jgi:hypothetical protein
VPGPRDAGYGLSETRAIFDGIDPPEPLGQPRAAGQGLSSGGPSIEPTTYQPGASNNPCSTTVNNRRRRMAPNRLSALSQPTRSSCRGRRLCVLIGRPDRVSLAALLGTGIRAQSPGVFSQSPCSADRLTVCRWLASPPSCSSVLPGRSSRHLRDKHCILVVDRRDIEPHPGAWTHRSRLES